MMKFFSALLAATLMATTNPSFAVPAPVVPSAMVVGGGGSGAGAAAAGGVVGVAGFLVFYDLIRRTSCSGDFLRLGGPGFSTPNTIGQNVLTPVKCKSFVHKKHRTVLHAKG